MARNAIVFNGRVVNLVDIPPGGSYGGIGTAVPSETANWWDNYDGANFTPGYPWATLAEAKLSLRMNLRALRKSEQTKGITVGANFIPTDNEFISQIRALKEWSDANPGENVTVEKADGEFVTVTRAAFLNVASQMAAHVRGCIANEAAHAAAIAAMTTLAQAAAYDISTGWPT